MTHNWQPGDSFRLEMVPEKLHSKGLIATGVITAIDDDYVNAMEIWHLHRQGEPPQMDTFRFDSTHKRTDFEQKACHLHARAPEEAQLEAFSVFAKPRIVNVGE